MDWSARFNTISFAASLGSTGWEGIFIFSNSYLKSVNFISYFGLVFTRSNGAFTTNQTPAGPASRS